MNKKRAHRTRKPRPTRHNWELPRFEEKWQQNQHWVVLGLVEDSHIGELGIGVSPPCEDEDGDVHRHTMPVFHGGEVDIIEDDEIIPCDLDWDVVNVDKQLRNYDDQNRSSEDKLALLYEMEQLATQYDRCYEDHDRARRERDRLSNVEQLGCESRDERLTEYRKAIRAVASLSQTQGRVLDFTALGLSQAHIAKKLKMSQQAVSKALFRAQNKLHAVDRKIGGPHNVIAFRLIHYSDTHGYTEWAKRRKNQTGSLPGHCRYCLGGEVTQSPSLPTNEEPDKPVKKCRLCRVEVGNFREWCPVCGGKLTIPRRTKRKGINKTSGINRL
jgi:DNA-binding CsgD family transcriptional regulator